VLVFRDLELILLPAGSAAGSSAGIVFTHGPILGVFAPQGRHVAPIKVKFGSASFDLDRFRGVGLQPPKLKKKLNFTIIIAARFLQNL